MLTKNEKLVKVKDWLKTTKLDAEVVGRTLGINESSINANVLLQASAKLIKVNKREVEPDDRDNLRFSKFLGMEDYVAEHIDKDAGQIQRKAAQKMQQKRNLSWMSAGFFTPQVRSVVIGNALSQNVDGINPIEHWDNSHRVTKLGPGGIPCHSADTEVFTMTGWVPWAEVTTSCQLGCLVNGALEFHTPSKLFAQPFNGKLSCLTTDRLNYAVTPDHRLYTSHEVNLSKQGTRYWTEFSPELASEAHGKKRRHRVSALPWAGGTPIPEIIDVNGLTLPGVPWCKFLAYWMADGYFSYKPESYEYRVFLTKVKEANPEEWVAMDTVLQQLGLTYSWENDKHQFRVNSKPLAEYLRQFAKSSSKHLPDYVKSFDFAGRELVFSSVLKMDGNSHTEFSTMFQSASKPLVEDMGWLATTLGYATTYYTRVRKRYDEELAEWYDEVQHHVLLQRKQHCLAAVQRDEQPFSWLDYNGLVYCAEVLGNQLLTRRAGKTFWSGNSIEAVPDESRQVNTSSFGFFDPVHIMESDKVGVTNYLAHNVIKGRDNKLYRIMEDSKGKKSWVDHETVLNKQAVIPEH